MKINRIEFDNFKSFSRFSINISEINIIVGPNNSGKSTIIGSLRVLDIAIRSAKNAPPTRINIDENTHIGYWIPADRLPISIENIRTNYNDLTSKITFVFSNKNKIEIIFPKDGGCALVPHSRNKAITSRAVFRSEFPINLIIVPVLGPLEHEERLLKEETVNSALSTHRASRHFRNYWRNKLNEFSKFADLISNTWPGMELTPPELDAASGLITMFCRENRIDREIYWTGFGFQIWCQLLTHVSRANQDTIFVVDEPEVYLHADVQRQLLSILKETQSNIIASTHSSEIIAEADPSELILIDKSKLSGERLRNVHGIQRALDVVGSSQNVTLTALARNRRVLFVEGTDDFNLIRRFAKKLGYHELAAGIGITPIPSGGFGSWQKIATLAEGISDALGAPLLIGAIYDRDYYCDEQIDEIQEHLCKKMKFVHIFQSKEIENYLLSLPAIERIISRSHEGGNVKEIEIIMKFIDDFSNAEKDGIFSQRLSKYTEYMRNSSKDSSYFIKNAYSDFHSRWSFLEERLKMIPGKEAIRRLREFSQEKYGVTLTDSKIVSSLHLAEVSAEIVEMIGRLEQFRTMN